MKISGWTYGETFAECFTEAAKQVRGFLGINPLDTEKFTELSAQPMQPDSAIWEMYYVYEITAWQNAL